MLKNQFAQIHIFVFATVLNEISQLLDRSGQHF